MCGCVDVWMCSCVCVDVDELADADVMTWMC